MDTWANHFKFAKAICIRKFTFMFTFKVIKHTTDSSLELREPDCVEGMTEVSRKCSFLKARFLWLLSAK